MENYCAFSKNHKCPKWTDYQLTLFELAEADCIFREICASVPKERSAIPLETEQRSVGN